MRKLTVASIVCLLFLLISVKATTINVASPGNGNDIRPAITTAVNGAVNGDLIVLPAGTFKFSGTVNVTKFISFKGAGIGQTILYRDDAVSDASLYYVCMFNFNINSDSSRCSTFSNIS